MGRTLSSLTRINCYFKVFVAVLLNLSYVVRFEDSLASFTHTVNIRGGDVLHPVCRLLILNIILVGFTEFVHFLIDNFPWIAIIDQLLFNII